MISIFNLFIIIPVINFLLLAINFIFAPQKPYKEKKTPFECGYHSFLAQNRTQFTISFFIFGLLFLLFDIEIVSIYPLTVSSYFNGGYGFFVIIIFVLVLALGFVFELGKGALKIDTKQEYTFLQNSASRCIWLVIAILDTKYIVSNKSYFYTQLLRLKTSSYKRVNKNIYKLAIKIMCKVQLDKKLFLKKGICLPFSSKFVLHMVSLCSLVRQNKLARMFVVVIIQIILAIINFIEKLSLVFVYKKFKYSFFFTITVGAISYIVCHMFNIIDYTSFSILFTSLLYLYYCLCLYAKSNSDLTFNTIELILVLILLGFVWFVLNLVSSYTFGCFSLILPPAFISDYLLKTEPFWVIPYFGNLWEGGGPSGGDGPSGDGPSGVNLSPKFKNTTSFTTSEVNDVGKYIEESKRKLLEDRNLKGIQSKVVSLGNIRFATDCNENGLKHKEVLIEFIDQNPTLKAYSQLHKRVGSPVIGEVRITNNDLIGILKTCED